MSANRFAIAAPRIFDGLAWHENAALVAGGGRFERVCTLDDLSGDCPVLAHSKGLIVPGYVDLQVNGGGGILFNHEPSADCISRICAAHIASGTTRLLVTLISDSEMSLERAIAAAIEAQRRRVAGFLGLHLEGPHLAAARHGAHDASLLVPMSERHVARLVAAKQELEVLMVTLAPEMATVEQVRELVAAGIIVSLGHSEATAANAASYAEAGASVVTHLFNAMSQMGPREAGLVGAALMSGALSASIIADGLHVAPEMVELALRAKVGPGSLFLVSDAMATVGSAVTSLDLNGRRVTLSDGRLTLADGTLAGAHLDLAAAVRFLVLECGMALERALQMASAIPADVAGAPHLGRLVAGSPADFILLDDDLRVRETWVNGVKVEAARD